MNPSYEKDEKTESLRRLIRRLHEGADIRELKEEFKQVVAEASGPEISQLEEELIKEGVPRDEVHRLCDLHLEVFRESLDRTGLVTPPGHPIHILMEEHSVIQRLADERREIASDLLKTIDPASTESMIERLKHITEQLETGEKHY
ncbi:DUF438 domain-containing protein, partial [Candidatus Bathyarchaeota archaeon]|nr:DUF438 domain-containing protein [Candidatus Bathyarchaeota archaeon]